MSEKENKYKISAIFECAQCGFCCHGETTVSLDEHDQQRMAEALHLSVEETRDKYWRVTGKTVQMKVRDGHCIFYDKDVGCTVHEGRPWRCREWPLHRSMLHDINNYQTITTSCPGFKPDLSYDEFCIILKAILDNPETNPCNK